jgi:SAM-dependent methyltransferase
MPDLRAMLDAPWAYRLYQSLVGGNRSHRLFVRDFVRPGPGARILDIGCGPADIIDCLPGVDYVGFDANYCYIATARRRYGALGEFACRRVDEEAIGRMAAFDVVIAHGLLHHLDDTEGRQLFLVARSALKPDGRFLTLDGVYVAGQSPLARYLIARDRGRHVRSESDYRSLAATVFSEVTLTVRHDMMYVPYTLLIMDCRKTD